MTVRFAQKKEIDNWNNLIITNPDGGDIFQTAQFANVKSLNNWTPRYIVLDNLYVLVLERRVPFLGAFWYVPKGPGVSDVSTLKKILPDLIQIAKSNSVFTVKIEPEFILSAEITKKMHKLGLSNSKPVQAANTVIVDLSKTLDEIIANFSSKARGNIRAAEKAGVISEIVPATDENCTLFYEMMSQTINGRSHVRSYEYFRDFWQSHDQAGTGLFMFAKADGKVVSMDFIMTIGKKAARKDAASTRDHSIRGASAFLELEAIKYLKEKGVTAYDLYGAPPSDQIKNPDHPYFGFGTFKVGFNPEITDYIGCYDLIIKPFQYKIWQKYGERIAKRVYRYLHNDLYY